MSSNKLERLDDWQHAWHNKFPFAYTPFWHFWYFVWRPVCNYTDHLHTRHVTHSKSSAENLLQYIASMVNCEICYPNGVLKSAGMSGICSHHRDPVLMANGYFYGVTHQGGLPRNYVDDEIVALEQEQEDKVWVVIEYNEWEIYDIYFETDLENLSTIIANALYIKNIELANLPSATYVQEHIAAKSKSWPHNDYDVQARFVDGSGNGFVVQLANYAKDMLT